MTEKTAYQTDSAGIYVGDTVADESPLEPGVWLLPAGATFDALPAEWPADKWPRHVAGHWELVTRPAVVDSATPTAKLAAFLAANPDVAAMIDNSGQPDAGDL